ncbi:serine hydrolase domain-containing protein [Qipengyuania sp. DSG2-2]|uniref:serine hydrolase domain-containing protein n=1 Tax=Qipengyuania sp. DGS2-2 TaxID=3349631 RepID=UPI0036D3C1AE
MPTRRCPPIALRTALPTAFIGAASLLLNACDSDPAEPPPLSEDALAAIAADPGAPNDQLARQLDELFTNDAVGETRAAVVMHGGQIAAERYADGYTADTRFVSWSMAKTVTAVMIGMLVADGKLSLDETPPIPRWRRPGDPRGEITLRQLLQMRAGLRHTEAGNPPYESSEVRMLFLDGRDNMADYATSQPLEAEPGREFEYSSNTTVILADIAARVLTDGSDDPETRRKAVAEFLEARMFGPLGMESMVPEFDAAGTLVGGSLIHGTARDWGRFGDFLRNEGSYRGSQLVPRSWIAFMTEPSPASGFYGGQTWLNRESGIDRDDTLVDRGPETLFAAVGHMGQYVLVSPSQKLTLVRLGHSDQEERKALIAEMLDVVELYPET